MRDYMAVAKILLDQPGVWTLEVHAGRGFIEGGVGAWFDSGEQAEQAALTLTASELLSTLLLNNPARMWHTHNYDVVIYW